MQKEEDRTASASAVQSELEAALSGIQDGTTGAKTRWNKAVKGLKGLTEDEIKNIYCGFDGQVATGPRGRGYLNAQDGMIPMLKKLKLWNQGAPTFSCSDEEDLFIDLGLITKKLIETIHEIVENALGYGCFEEFAETQEYNRDWIALALWEAAGLHIAYRYEWGDLEAALTELLVHGFVSESRDTEEKLKKD